MNEQQPTLVPGDTTGSAMVRFAAIASVSLAFALLYVGREVFIPIAMAVFFTFMLSGVAGWFERRGASRFAAGIAALSLAMLTLASITGLVFYRGSVLLDELPQYRNNIKQKVTAVQSSLHDWFGNAHATVTELQREIAAESAPDRSLSNGPALQPEAVKVEVVKTAESTSLALGNAALQVVTHPLITVGIALVLTVFFLLYREDLRDRIMRVLGETTLHVSTNALSDAGEKVSRYLSALALANAIAGAGVSVGLLVLGVPNWFLWGCLTGILRFVPVLGPLLGATFPVVVSIAVSESWIQPVLVVVWFLIVDLTIANFVEPLLYGSRTGASPTAIMLSFIVWTWLWGPFGLFLATPITVCLVALGRHISALEIFATLLGDQPVFRPSVRFYQRILAGDAPAAHQVLAETGRELDRQQLLDHVIAPAIGRVAGDWTEDLFTPERKTQIVSTLEDALRTFDSQHAADEPETLAKPSQRVIVWTSGHPLEDALLPWVQSELARDGVAAELCSSKCMLSDVAALVRVVHPHAVVLFSGIAGAAKRIPLLERMMRGVSPYPRIIVLGFDPLAGAGAEATTRRAQNPLAVRSLKGLIDAIRLIDVRTVSTDCVEAVPLVAKPLAE